MSVAKKIFIISFVVFIILLLLGGIYFFSFKKTALEKPEIITEIPAIKETEVITKKQILSAISDESVLGPVLINEQSAIKYYSKKTGKVYQIEFDGSGKMPISEQELFGLNKVSWSPNLNQVITSFSSQENSSFSYYDHVNRVGNSLKNNIDNIVWQTNDKILYKYYDSSNGTRTLNISNPDGSNWKKLIDLDFSRLEIAPVPMTGLISFWNQGNGLEETLLQTISLLGEEKKILFKGKFGADYLWSPDGNHLLISNVLEKASSKLQIGLTNNSGGEYNDLGLPTITAKCAWSNNSENIYCALPGMIPDNAIMPNDYFANNFKTADTFWKINIASGKKDRLLDLDKMKDLPTVDAYNLFLNEDESLLFFINRYDEKLYRLEL